MKRLICAALCAFSMAGALAATSLPPELVGVWGSRDAVFKGDALMNGKALYLDANGKGASIAGNGKDVLGVRLVVTAYNQDNHTLSVEMTESRNVMIGNSMVYDPAKKILFSRVDPKQTYERRFEEISDTSRKSFGLDEKAK